MPQRQDDPTLTGVVYRRIPPWAGRVTWLPNGEPEPSTQNFKDANNELSLFLASEASLEVAYEGHREKGFGMVWLTIEDFRSILGDGLIICREPPPGHVIVCFKTTNGQAKALRKKAKWVEGHWPQKLAPTDTTGVE